MFYPDFCRFFRDKILYQFNNINIVSIGITNRLKNNRSNWAQISSWAKAPQTEGEVRFQVFCHLNLNFGMNSISHSLIRLPFVINKLNLNSFWNNFERKTRFVRWTSFQLQRQQLTLYVFDALLIWLGHLIQFTVFHKIFLILFFTNGFIIILYYCFH